MHSNESSGTWESMVLPDDIRQLVFADFFFLFETVVLMRGDIQGIYHGRMTRYTASVTGQWNRLVTLCLWLNLFIFCVKKFYGVSEVHQSADHSIWLFEPGTMNVIGAWSNLLTWANLLGMLRPFPSTGPFVHMFIRIIWEIRAFLLIYVAIIWAFAFAFYMSVPIVHPADVLTDNPTLFSFTTPYQSFYVTYLMSVGEFADYLALLQEFSFNSTSTLIMFGMFIMLVIIVLLNLLIAIMGEAYNNVICDGVEDDWRYYQCGVICEQERAEHLNGSVNRKEVREKYPTYLHIIEPNIPTFKAKLNYAQLRLSS